MPLHPRLHKNRAIIRTRQQQSAVKAVIAGELKLDGLKEFIHHLYAVARQLSHPDSFMPPRAEPVPLKRQMPRQRALRGWS